MNSCTFITTFTKIFCHSKCFVLPLSPLYCRCLEFIGILEVLPTEVSFQIRWKSHGLGLGNRVGTTISSIQSLKTAFATPVPCEQVHCHETQHIVKLQYTGFYALIYTSKYIYRIGPLGLGRKEMFYLTTHSTQL